MTLGVNTFSVRVPSPLVSWRHKSHSNYSLLQCYGEYGVTPYSLLIWARLTENQMILLVATELFRIPLVGTLRNEEWTSSATSFCSFLKKQKSKKLTDDGMSMKMMIERIFVLKSCILYFILFSSFFLFELFYFPFLIREIRNTKTVNNMSARE